MFGNGKNFSLKGGVNTAFRSPLNIRKCGRERESELTADLRFSNLFKKVIFSFQVVDYSEAERNFSPVSVQKRSEYSLQKSS